MGPDAKLRSYQTVGLQWLLFNHSQGRGSILADEMGLGKTLQIVSFLYSLMFLRGVQGPFLVVAPVSTLEHWERESERWSGLNCLVFRGLPEARQQLHRHEFSRGIGPANESKKENKLSTGALNQAVGGAWANVWAYLRGDTKLGGKRCTERQVESM